MHHLRDPVAPYGKIARAQISRCPTTKGRCQYPRSSKQIKGIAEWRLIVLKCNIAHMHAQNDDFPTMTYIIAEYKTRIEIDTVVRAACCTQKDIVLEIHGKMQNDESPLAQRHAICRAPTSQKHCHPWMLIIDTAPLPKQRSIKHAEWAQPVTRSLVAYQLSFHVWWQPS